MGVTEALGMKSGSGAKVRYALVGAGWIAQAAFMPAVERTGNSELVAVVTGDAEKARELAEKYELKRTCDYSDYGALLRSGDVDAVYISTPNWDHVAYAVQALEAGIHVLVEKPMEVSVERCERILAAAEKSSAKLMVAYRLHFEPATLDALERVRKGELGEVRFFSSVFAQHVARENQRGHNGFDGGPVLDMGPYPINAARNLFGEEPVEVSAFGTRNEDAGLGDFDDTVAVSLRFGDGRLAQFVVSYAGNSFGAYTVVGTKGVLEMSPGYTFQGALQERLTLGEKKPKAKKFEAVDQFAGQTKYFSQCVLDGTEPEPGAEEGLLDVRVIEAVKRALETGQAQKLEPWTRRRKVEADQERDFSQKKAPKLVHAAPPEEEKAS